MSTTKIRNCQFAFRCTKKWEELLPTRKSSVKFCNDCTREVFYCSTDSELVRAVKLGRCVAIDVVVGPERKGRTRRPPRGGEETGRLLGDVDIGLLLPKSDDEL